MLRRRQVLKQQYFSLSLWLLPIMKIAIIIAEKNHLTQVVYFIVFNVLYLHSRMDYQTLSPGYVYSKVRFFPDTFLHAI